MLVLAFAPSAVLIVTAVDAIAIEGSVVDAAIFVDPIVALILLSVIVELIVVV